MDRSEPFERAGRIAAGLLTDADLTWLQGGFRTWCRAAGAVTLDRCLQLSGPRRGRIAMRDALLAELVDVLPRKEGEGVGGAVLSALSAFERGAWGRWHGLPAAPSGASRVERVLFDLVRLGCPVPRTARGIRMCLRGKASGANVSDLIQEGRRAA